MRSVDLFKSLLKDLDKRRQSINIDLRVQEVLNRNEPYPDRFKLGKWLSKELLSLFRDKVKIVDALVSRPHFGILISKRMRWS
jgi:hypothetical protein